jgi:predicted DNA-binding protein (MmcQ/YjbR family)
MVNEQIAAYCLSKPGAYLDYPFGPEVAVIKVRKRIFAQLFYLKGKPMATFNCDRTAGEFYRAIYPGVVTRGYHCPPVQQPYFNTVRLDGTVPDNEIRNMIDHSYAVVTAKLPKYVQKELLESDNET